MYKLLTAFLMIVCISGCSKTKLLTQQATKVDMNIEATEFIADKSTFKEGEKISISGKLHNQLNNKAVLRSLKLKIRNLSRGSSFFSEIPIGEEVSIAGGGEYVIDSPDIWQVPADAEKDAYGIYLSFKDTLGQDTYIYLTFFRVVDDKKLSVYKIDRDNWNGVYIFKLDGGMSAEYAVEKSLENLGRGIAQSWDVNAPGSGPNPVYATPEFLVNSIAQTVNNYNNYLGSATPLESVIISTGIPSIPNISNTLKAPVLPLHFLVSSNTEKEIQSVLDYSNLNGVKCYATLGYDLSVPTAVCWVKLLDLPPAYLSFIREHQVKKVYIIGSTGTTGGETRARQVINKSPGRYQSGSIYILYAGNTADDVATMRDKIRDYDELTLDNYNNISDWESGIISEQVSNISHALKIEAQCKAYSVTAENLVNLYDLGTDVTLAYFKKNNIQVKGVTINPYLLSHPVYEARNGFVPYNYWQLSSAQSTVGAITNRVKNAVLSYFPQTNFNNLSIWVNSSNNFGAATAAQNLITALKQNGYTNIRTNDYTQDEVWNPSNGMDAPCEKIANDILSDNGYFDWNQRQSPLTTEEFSDVIGKIPGVIFSAE